ncbi:PREDICTED: synaptic vesicle membrane protein VAT-1 homolog [Trachymyrmex cornetzi]|uniref:synaptic vesicle membrane protein VAT-1 homolog n=1 Tax=Trachymyrmex cornetzi TaxID=471704 RepID=UPI00084EF1C2|nr:PREDICTED: synaptic vesicle membrane protein VAT-1 homolog [Trachymyrmex cornetzi]
MNQQGNKHGCSQPAKRDSKNVDDKKKDDKKKDDKKPSNDRPSNDKRNFPGGFKDMNDNYMRQH